jgi:hypothetical protein
VLARAIALTSPVRHFGQGVTGRPPWSLWLGMFGPHPFPHGTCQLSHNDSRQIAGRRAGCKAEVVSSDPFGLLGGFRHGPTAPINRDGVWIGVPSGGALGPFPDATGTAVSPVRRLVTAYDVRTKSPAPFEAGYGPLVGGCRQPAEFEELNCWT